jgi:stage III sporulation protein AC
MPLDEIAQNMPPDLAQRCGLHPEGIVRTVAESADQITDREAAAVLSRTAERLGRGEAEDQIALCRTAAATLEACRDRLTACAERDRRTRATVCMTGGAARDHFTVVGGERMDISLILKVVGVGFLVSFATQLLSKSGRDEQVMLVTVSGIVTVLLLLVGEIGSLFAAVRAIFGL